jgi:hypothetical protein
MAPVSWLAMDFWIMLMVKFVVCCFRGRQALAMENIAMRQQLGGIHIARE